MRASSARALRLAAPALALGAVVAGAAAAGSGGGQRLSGSYGLALSQTCVIPPLAPPPNPAFAPDGSLLQAAEIITATSTGVLRFSRSGSVSLQEGRLTELFHARTQPGSVPVPGVNAYQCSGHYELREGRLAVDLACDVEPPRPGIAIRIDPFVLTGFVSRDHERIELAALEGNLQITEVLAGQTVVQRRERICLQQLSLSRL